MADGVYNGQSNMNNNQMPEIRFKGFNELWERKRLGEIVTRISEFSGDDELPRVEYEDIISGQGQLNKDITKKDNNKTGVIFESGDVLFGKLRPYLKNWLLADFQGIAVGDFWVLRANSGVDKAYFYSLIQSDIFSEITNISVGTKMPRADWHLVSNTKFGIPSEQEEQSRIGAFFQCLDALITFYQRKHDKLTDIKKAMLEKMFPREGRDVPEIRFKGFDGPWERKRLGEIVFLFNNPVDTPHDGYERLGIRSHGKGTFHEYVKAGHELGTAQMYKVEANNFIVNITFAWEHAVAITNEKDAGKLVSHRFPQFSLDDKIAPLFLKYLILDERFRHHLWLSSPGGAGRNRVLKIDEMLEYSILLPDKIEQQKISSFLDKLDSLITLYHRKTAKLRDIKAAMLGKMFV